MVIITDAPLSDVPEARVLEMNVLFSLEKLDAALAACRRSSSPGPNGITYAALCQLGHDARGERLKYYNESWHNRVVPKQWKLSRLISILKSGKPPLDLL